MTDNVSKFPKRAAASVAEGLRDLADRIDTGEVGNECAVVVVKEGEAASIFAFGPRSSESFTLLGMVSRASVILSHYYGEDE